MRRSCRSHFVTCLLVAVGCGTIQARPANGQTVPEAAASDSNDRVIAINISHEIPADLPPLPTGRKTHTLTEAGVFAWRMFIAVTWPSKNQDGSFGSRDEPDTSRRYGQKGRSGHVVWETFRHKSEIFPGKGVPNGYDDPNAADFGYDALPKYVYMEGEIQPAQGPSPQVPPYNNLDEIDQIFLCNMHAGISENGIVLFQAKANRVLYKYIAEDRPNHGGPLFTQTLADAGILILQRRIGSSEAVT